MTDQTPTLERMGERRSFRGISRTDDQIRNHDSDMALLRGIAAQEIVNSPELRSDLRRLTLDDLILVGFAPGSRPTLLPRGERMLA